MPKKKRIQNTYIVWEGFSNFDQTPLVLLISGVRFSDNDKTGNMLQTYILRQDIEPTEAVKTGLDYATCGNCSQRPSIARKTGSSICYVNLGKSVLNIWRKYYRGGYDTLDPRYIKGRKLRMGSYGDPAAIPFPVWEKLLKTVDSHTGYTSSWQEPFATHLKGICQASCNTLNLKEDAEQNGWKTFTNLPEGSQSAPNAILCPNVKNNDNKCMTCGLCNGDTQNVFLYDHGLPWKRRVLTTESVLV